MAGAGAGGCACAPTAGAGVAVARAAMPEVFNADIAPLLDRRVGWRSQRRAVDQRLRQRDRLAAEGCQGRIFLRGGAARGAGGRRPVEHQRELALGRRLRRDV